MATRPRQHVPPYEVLSKRFPETSAPSGNIRGPRGQSEPRLGSIARLNSAIGTWVGRARHPIMLRIPRGFAALAVVAFFGLVLLAYWAGAQRYRPGAQSPIEPAAEHWADVPGPLNQGLTVNLWYIELTTFLKNPGQPEEHRQEAHRCVGFLKKHGVETTTDLADNGDLRLLVLPGFEEDKIRQDAYDQNMRRLANLGRIWKSQYRGLSDFSPRPVQYLPRIASGT